MLPIYSDYLQLSNKTLAFQGRYQNAPSISHVLLANLSNVVPFSHNKCLLQVGSAHDSVQTTTTKSYGVLIPQLRTMSERQHGKTSLPLLWSPFRMKRPMRTYNGTCQAQSDSKIRYRIVALEKETRTQMIKGMAEATQVRQLVHQKKRSAHLRIQHHRSQRHRPSSPSRLPDRIISHAHTSSKTEEERVAEAKAAAMTKASYSDDEAIARMPCGLPSLADCVEPASLIKTQLLARSATIPLAGGTFSPLPSLQAPGDE